jgi:hypothetical protein
MQSILVCAALLILAYLIVANRMLGLSKKFRIDAVRVGTRLLNDPTVDERIRREVVETLLDLPKATTPWRYAIGVIPASVRVLRKEPKMLVRLDASYYRPWVQFRDASLFAAICNSPAAAALFALLLLLVSLIVWPNKIISSILENDQAHPIW